VQFWQAIVQASELSFPVIFHTQNFAVQLGNPTVPLVYLPTPWWHHLKANPFLAIRSADEHRMVYSFSSTTSYSTFYAFVSSFRITLWLMWLLNSKRQPCFYPPQSHAQEDPQNWQKNWQNRWETCAVPENIQFSFLCSFFYTVKLHSLTCSAWDPIRWQHYNLTLTLICKVDFDFQESKLKVADRQVEFVLKKATDGWWPRLTATPQKPTWLKVLCYNSCRQV